MITNVPGIEIEYCKGIYSGCKNAVIVDRNLLHKLIDTANQSNWSRKFIKKEVLKHHLIKIGISGCPNACARSQIKDLGLIAKSEVIHVEDSCINCMGCVASCEEQAIIFNNDKIWIDKNRCIGCGKCVKLCETDAMKEKRQYFSILVGGRLGRHPRFGQEILQLEPFNTLHFISFFLSLFHRFNITQPKKIYDVISPEEIKIEYSNL